MYKMLILEDEMWISSLIKTFVKKNFEIISHIICCENGIEALEILSREKPDVALVDINVPLLNGLEVIDQARKQNSQCRFVIITGYKDFDYVHSALKAGVVDYLLKPVDEAELCSVLNRIFDKMQSEQELKNTLTQNSYLLKVQFLKQVFFGQDKNAFTDYQQYGFLFQGNLFQCVILKLIHQQLNYILPNTLELMYQNITTCASLSFKEYCYDFFCFHQGSLITLVLNPKEMYQYKILKQIDKFFESLLEHAQSNTLNLSAGISAVHTDDIHSLGTAHQEAFWALNTRIKKGLNKVIQYGTDTPDLLPFNTRLLSDDEQHDFTKYILSQDSVGLERWFHRIIESFENLSHVHDAETLPFLPLLEQIADLFCQEINKFNITTVEKNQILDKMDICSSTSDLCTAFVEELTQILNHVQQKLSENKISASISLACQYINDHLSDSLTLESVASYVYLNSTYLSELFKTETGKNFKDYILEKRMELACELLKTSMKVTEVAARAGYADAKHFSKTFKKYKGISPKEYQRIYI